MSYKIAIASSDGKNIDETFGSAKDFHIFEVSDESYDIVEVRKINEENFGSISGCDNNSGCSNSGCHAGSGGVCSGSTEISAKVELISDCRCVVCKKIGFNIQKQLERRAITFFDVTCSVNEALDKISSYFQRVDTHQSLRGIRNYE